MSTDDNARGGKRVADDMVTGAKRLVDEAAAREKQMNLLEPVTPEEMARAQEELGKEAGALTVLDYARKSRRGRRLGSRNRRSDDFERYIRQFGRDPAITLMEIQSTPPEVLVQRSRDLDPAKRQMSYADAQQIRVRCAEALMPYLHGKKPVEVDLGVSGDFNLIIPGVNVSQADAERAAAGSFVLDVDYEDVDDREGGE